MPSRSAAAPPARTNGVGHEEGIEERAAAPDGPNDLKHPNNQNQAESRDSVVREHADGRDAFDLMPSKRRMPDNLRRYLLRMQGGKMYLPAAYRIVWFRDELGDDWGIKTTLVEGGHEAGFATVHAEIVNPDGRVIASGLKTEAKSDFPAGWVEKAESGAVARALALLGFGTQFTPELDDDGRRPADSPQNPRSGFNAPAADAPLRSARPEGVWREARDPRAPMNGGAAAPKPSAAPAGEVWNGPGQCPTCHAPEGKRHGRTCLS